MSSVSLLSFHSQGHAFALLPPTCLPPRTPLGGHGRGTAESTPSSPQHNDSADQALTPTQQLQGQVDSMRTFIPSARLIASFLSKYPQAKGFAVVSPVKEGQIL